MALLTRIRALFVLGLALLCACSAPIHIAQPVEVPTAGTWQVGLGLGASTSSGALDLLDQAESSGKDLAKSQWQCKDTQNRSDCLPAFRLRDGLRAAYGAGLAGLLDVNAEVSGLYGFGHGLAAGARLASSGQRVDVLWQFLGTPGSTGWLGTALVGYSHTTGGPPSVLAKVTELLQIPRRQPPLAAPRRAIWPQNRLDRLVAGRPALPALAPCLQPDARGADFGGCRGQNRRRRTTQHRHQGLVAPRRRHGRALARLQDGLRRRGAGGLERHGDDDHPGQIGVVFADPSLAEFDGVGAVLGPRAQRAPAARSTLSANIAETTTPLD